MMVKLRLERFHRNVFSRDTTLAHRAKEPSHRDAAHATFGWEPDRNGSGVPDVLLRDDNSRIGPASQTLPKPDTDALSTIFISKYLSSYSGEVLESKNGPRV